MISLLPPQKHFPFLALVMYEIKTTLYLCSSGIKTEIGAVEETLFTKEEKQEKCGSNRANITTNHHNFGLNLFSIFLFTVHETLSDISVL
jgi:hypothetical protein